MEVIESKYGLCFYPYTKGYLRNLEYQNSEYNKVYHTEKEISGFIIPYDDGKYAYVTYYRNPEIFRSVGMISSRKVGYIKRMKDGFELTVDTTLTDIQHHIIHQIIGGRTPDNLMNNQWYIQLSTGFGKTLTALYLASRIRYKTLVLCFSAKILKQWIKTLNKKFIINDDSVIYIDSSYTLEALSEERIDPDKHDIFICTSNLIDNFGKKYGYASLEVLFNKLGIGLMIIDEAHRSFGKTIRICAVTNIRYTLFLSADYGLGNPKNEQRFLNAFNRVALIRPPEEIREEMKYTTAVVIEFNSHPSQDEQMSAIFTKFGYNAEKYMQYELAKQTIYDAILYILSIIKKVNENHYKVLILCTNIEPVLKLWEFLSYHPDTMDQKIGKYYGSLSDEEKESVEDNDIIIATYGSFSTGIDITTIRYVIGTNQSNKIEDNQTAGRAGRQFQLANNFPVFYFMLVDVGFSYCKKKLKLRLNYLSEMKLNRILKLQYISDNDDHYDDFYK